MFKSNGVCSGTSRKWEIEMGGKNQGYHHHQYPKLLEHTREIDLSIERVEEVAALNRTGLKHAGTHGQMSSNSTLGWWTAFVRSYKYGQYPFK